ncbi:predicted protein [Naegleria gruberi]|uniref:Predicted protein n=1 Tax=Naegleria gruberi TaxID=5762 RepID=D2W3L6_NAEGR|nr:uncharacterized protein NAEGRDRAFT_54443 [Naegleria gruberi]EFC36356.1 predicted protein [Naegleria gruberi]|eukprot:XP_002669100.1 predicted protein [Naegleria gruberi strain NEG-M]
MNSSSFQQNQEHSVTDSEDLAKSPAIKPIKKTRRKKTLMEHYKIIESPPKDSNNISNSTSTFSTINPVQSGHTLPTSIHGASIGNSPTRTILPSLSSVIFSDIDRLNSKHASQLPPILLNHDYNHVENTKKIIHSNSEKTSLLSNNSSTPLSNNNTIKKRKSRNEPSSPLINNTRDFQLEYTGNNSIFGVMKKPKHANMASYETILNLSDTSSSNSNQRVKTPPTTTTRSWSPHQESQIQSTNKKKRKKP